MQFFSDFCTLSHLLGGVVNLYASGVGCAGGPDRGRVVGVMSMSKMLVARNVSNRIEKVPEAESGSAGYIL